VDVGTGSDAARRLNAPYIKHRTTGLPYVTAKVATTLDGKIAAIDGRSKWISSDVTRAWVHRQLRDRVDAIMVGVGTVLNDDPRLTTRLSRPDRRNPLRIVVDSKLTASPAANFIRPEGEDGKALIACVEGASPVCRAALEAVGATVLECAPDDMGRVDLRELMARLGSRGDIAHVMVEGGGLLIGSALRSGIVDRYIATIAPKLIGGGGAPGPIGGLALANSIGEALSPDRWIMRRSGPDIVIEAFLNGD
jgi:diaminohydroxyphosphoribosylaminopyrimidine deaminase/5-amino-6-(5-phosphoribosylamino)uracil reductase